MDIKKYAAGKARGIGGVTKHGASTFLISAFNGYNPDTGEPNPTKDTGMQRVDVVRKRDKALADVAEAQARVDAFNALLSDIDAL